ncbi:MAG TPA: ABC transporter ATP-binding protein [Candidatus Ornithoclostridium faecigallinarum]|nr:ABC transporter ATP-binding protein [Candidatus Ornithoclostridium faecigallinarum]
MKKTIVKYYTKYWLMILLSTAFLVCQALCELQLPTYMSDIITSGIAVGDMDQIWSIGIKMLAVALGCAVSAILVGYFSSTVGAALARDLRYDVFAKVGSFSSAEFDKFSQSSLITRGTNDITQIQIFSIMFLRLVMFAPVMGIGGIIKAVRFSSGMSGLVIVVAVAVAVLLVAIITMIATVLPKFKQMQTKIDRVNQVAQDELAGLMVIRAFNTQAHEEKRFEEANKDLTKTSLFAYRVMAILNPAITMVMFGVSIAVVWIAAVSAKDISEVGNMIAFIQYAMQIIMSFMMLSMAFVLMPRAAVSAERVADVLDTPASVVTPEHPTDANVDGDIVFDDVAYSYGGDAEAVRHISFTAKKGETTAIIGSTGSGKSTIVNLIPRMADATEGKVTIGGVDVRDFDLKKLRAGVGFVPQKNILFSGTIESNIKYSDEDMPDERMERAAEIAQATEFVASKEDGYKSEIAQGGDNVSGGQKQRIAIARALAKECPIYVFDDSFSALDFKTDAALRQALKDKLSGATIVIVAQRVGTIKNADNIIVLDDGEIVGQGTHEQLLASCPVYLDIAKSQLSEEELGL